MKIYKKTIFLIIFILISIGLYVIITSYNEYRVIDRQLDNFFNNQSSFDFDKFELLSQVKDAKYTQVFSGFAITLSSLNIFIILSATEKSTSGKSFFSKIILIILNLIIIINSSIFFIILSKIDISSSSNKSLINTLHNVQLSFPIISSVLFWFAGDYLEIKRKSKKIRKDLTH